METLRCKKLFFIVSSRTFFKTVSQFAASRTSSQQFYDKKFKKKALANGILDNEVLYGRAVCNIALKASRRPIFKLHLLKFWESSKPTDARVLETIALANERRIPTSYLSRNQLDSMSLNRPHQGVCMEVGEMSYRNMDKATCEKFLTQTDQIDHPRMWVLLCGILDPMNMGAILRSCFYFGVDKVAVTGTCAPLTPIVSKASSGAAEILQLHNADDPAAIIQVLRERDWEIIGTVANCPEKNGQIVAEDIVTFSVEKSSVVLFGSEGYGLPDELLALCTRLVTIQSPDVTSDNEVESSLRKLVGSLNVSTATAIILHKLRQSRLKECTVF